MLFPHSVVDVLGFGVVRFGIVLLTGFWGVVDVVGVAVQDGGPHEAVDCVLVVHGGVAGEYGGVFGEVVVGCFWVMW